MRHPDAARLLAWVDRELSALGAWQVRRHVNRCWDCRARVSQLERSITAVREALEPAAVDPVQLAKARWNFRQAAIEVERSIEPRRRFPLPAFIAAGAAIAVFAAVLALRSPVPHAAPQPTAANLLAAALSAETPAVRAAVREEQFSIEYRSGTRPPVRRELRVLSSPHRGAWTARWSTAQGDLQSAIFAAEAQEFTKASGLRPAVFRRPTAYKGLFDLASQDAEDIDRMILGWIRGQVWQPVSLAREVAEFCTRSGAVLRISADGTAVLWSAESTLGGTSISVHLEGVRGEAPAVLRLAWQSRTRSGVIRIKREARREYDDLQVAAALLHPHLPSRRPMQAETAQEPEASQAVGPALRDLLASQVAAMLALHKAGICKADQMRIDRQSDSIEAAGAFADDDQIERIADLLAGIPHLRVRLTTLDVSSIPVTQVAETAQERHMRPAAVEPWLRSRLGVGVRASEREMFNTMNAVVRDSEDLLSDSWALFRLAQTFPPVIESEMDSDTRAKLRGMADDHLVRISVNLAAIDGRLALQPAPQPVRAQTATWQDESHALHEEVKSTAEMLISLFAGGDIARTALSSDPEEAGVAGLIARVRSMATQVRAELSTELRSARQ